MLKRKADDDTRVNHLIAGRGIDWLTVKTRLKAQGAKGGKRNVAGLDPGPEASVRGDELSVIEGVKSYYSLLGVRGLAVVIKARLLRTRVKASVPPPRPPLRRAVQLTFESIRPYLRPGSRRQAMPALPRARAKFRLASQFSALANC